MVASDMACTTQAERVANKMRYLRRYKFCVVSLDASNMHRTLLCFPIQAAADLSTMQGYVHSKDKLSRVHCYPMISPSSHHISCRLFVTFQCTSFEQFSSILQGMENSNLKDYVTEKVYDGLVAGCVPLYLGAPNIQDYIPDNNSIINVDQLGSVEALKDELERLAADNEAYAEKLSWKQKEEETWNPGDKA